MRRVQVYGTPSRMVERNPMKAMIAAALLAGAGGAGAAAEPSIPAGTKHMIEKLMADHEVPGLAIATVEDGRVTEVATFGQRDREARLPLTRDTVMAGMSWTKFLFSAHVAELAAEGKIDLDRPIGGYLPRPLPMYPRYADLAKDERWRLLTLRHLLSHQSGLPNFRFFAPNSDLDRSAPLAFFRSPGEAYGYSGEGMQIAQLVVQEALGTDVGADLQGRQFEPLGLLRSGLSWQDRFASDCDIAYSEAGQRLGHDKRASFDAAGSLNTSIGDFAELVAAFQRGEIISATARKFMLTPQAPISSAHQFPPWSDKQNPSNGRIGLSAGLGVVLWTGRRGPGFFKGGHDDGGDNMLVCLVDEDKCILLMMNSPKGHLVFPQIVEAVLGPTDLPWAWEYSQLAK
jgi:CubicO group peptidase (beta-lactamase class C family)